MKYFTNIDNLEDLKKAFFTLAKKLHPDNGGNAADFTAMRNEYEKLFDTLKYTHKAASGKTYKADYRETPEQFREVIEKVIFFTGVKIEIIGSWVWVTGNTYKYRNELAQLHFFYSKNKRAWYWNGATERTHRRGHYTLDRIRATYGTQEVKTTQRAALA